MIYNVSNKENSRVNLWRSDSETFTIIQFDKFTPILIGSDYTIVNESLVSVFDELLSNEIEIKPIKIVRKSTEEQWDNFCELIIKEQ